LTQAAGEFDAGLSARLRAALTSWNRRVMDRIALRNAIVIRSQKNFRPNEKRRPRAPSVISIF